MFRQYDIRYALPYPELLKIHAVIAQILYASGRAEEIDKVLRDRDEISVLAANGKTDITCHYIPYQLEKSQNIFSWYISASQSEPLHINGSILWETEGEC